MTLGGTALRFSLGRFIFFVAAVLLAAAFVLPMLYTVLSSFKPIEEITKVPLQWLPETLDSIRLSNYSEPLERYNFGRYIANSIFVGALVTLASLIFCTMAGYSLSKLRISAAIPYFMVVLITL